MDELGRLPAATLARALQDLLPGLERAADVLAEYGYFNEAREAYERLALARHALGLPVTKSVQTEDAEK